MDSRVYSVLVVDDEEVNRRIATLFLQRAGYQVDEAINGLQAWQKLQTQHYDLILLDISMPEMSGIALCQRIRASQQGCGPAIVAYTAHAMAMEQKEILDAGFDDIVTKPIARSILIEAVERFVSRRQDAA